jgi:hypothetical protein
LAHDFLKYRINSSYSEVNYDNRNNSISKELMVMINALRSDSKAKIWHMTS